MLSTFQYKHREKAILKYDNFAETLLIIQKDGFINRYLLKLQSHKSFFSLTEPPRVSSCITKLLTGFVNKEIFKISQYSFIHLIIQKFQIAYGNNIL